MCPLLSFLLLLRLLLPLPQESHAAEFARALSLAEHAEAGAEAARRSNEELKETAEAALVRSAAAEQSVVALSAENVGLKEEVSHWLNLSLAAEVQAEHSLTVQVRTL